MSYASIIDTAVVHALGDAHSKTAEAGKQRLRVLNTATAAEGVGNPSAFFPASTAMDILGASQGYTSHEMEAFSKHAITPPRKRLEWNSQGHSGTPHHVRAGVDG